MSTATATYIYTYNPYKFCEDDYTQEELVQILRDICTGVCKPEIKTQRIVTDLEFYGEVRHARHQRSLRMSDAPKGAAKG
ncbi:MAG: hypothetical protein KME46_25820 [Brasilonema angustatum HA4187-MV1]|jgi:hypothetical protein|nr:hypothetical protein [Brasilonema angustatum HA4187-MV1]